MTRHERIVEMALRTAGPGIHVMTKHIDTVLEAGWDGIANGTVVYKDNPWHPTKTYTKINAETIETNDGQLVSVNDAQKTALVDTYAVLMAIPE